MHLHCHVNADALSIGDQAGNEARACCNDRCWSAGSACPVRASLVAFAAGAVIVNNVAAALSFDKDGRSPRLIAAGLLCAPWLLPLIDPHPELSMDVFWPRITKSPSARVTRLRVHDPVKSIARRP